jgi:4-hydroxy-tetrahydrodipicolinate reductase
MGYGRAGSAAARVIQAHPDYQLSWIMRRNPQAVCGDVPVHSIYEKKLAVLLDESPVEAIIDFSNHDAIYGYGPEIAMRKIALVSAISSYTAPEEQYLHSLGQTTRVLHSANITLGINFLMLAASLLRRMAPFADIAILEQHFREKPEVSGTAVKLANRLAVHQDDIVSLRLGGIVGQHEVIFGFPYQTVRLIHNSISKEAFGTGALHALGLLLQEPTGSYTLDQLLLKSIQTELATMS